MDYGCQVNRKDYLKDVQLRTRKCLSINTAAGRHNAKMENIKNGSINNKEKYDTSSIKWI